MGNYYNHSTRVRHWSGVRSSALLRNYFLSFPFPLSLSPFLSCSRIFWACKIQGNRGFSTTQRMNVWSIRWSPAPFFSTRRWCLQAQGWCLALQGYTQCQTHCLVTGAAHLPSLTSTQSNGSCWVPTTQWNASVCLKLVIKHLKKAWHITINRPTCCFCGMFCQ